MDLLGGSKHGDGDGVPVGGGDGVVGGDEVAGAFDKDEGEVGEFVGDGEADGPGGPVAGDAHDFGAVKPELAVHAADLGVAGVVHVQDGPSGMLISDGEAEDAEGLHEAGARPVGQFALLGELLEVADVAEVELRDLWQGAGAEDFGRDLALRGWGPFALGAAGAFAEGALLQDLGGFDPVGGAVEVLDEGEDVAPGAAFAVAEPELLAGVDAEAAAALLLVDGAFGGEPCGGIPQHDAALGEHVFDAVAGFDVFGVDHGWFWVAS